MDNSKFESLAAVLGEWSYAEGGLNVTPLDVMVRYEPAWLPDTGFLSPAATSSSQRVPTEEISLMVKTLIVKKQAMIKIVKVWM